MRFTRHVSEWWYDPDIRKPRVRIPKRITATDPTKPNDESWMPTQSRVGFFAHSRKWLRYHLCGGIEVGYLTKVYDLNEIAKRYGLSQAGKRYYRAHLLPEPFTIVTRRSVSAHHWSLFTLMALDVVLKDLEKRGFNQFLKTHVDHIQLLHDGTNYMHEYYRTKYEEKIVDTHDKLGVQWLT